MGTTPNSSKRNKPSQLKKSKTDSPPPLGDCWKPWVFSEILKVFNERRGGRRY